MTRVVFLDTGVLGLVTHPKGSEKSIACTRRLVDLLELGVRVCIPEVSDYELRREYLRRGSGNALRKLDQLQSELEYVALDTGAMRHAATLWAEVRRDGLPTADPKELDCDVILAAQAMRAVAPGDDLVVATDNVGHLTRFVAASAWDVL